MRGKGEPENSSCRYKGVRQRVWGRWVSEIRWPNRGESIWLGSFDNPENAAMAYDEAAIRIFGHTAQLNFPNRLPQVSLPVNGTAATHIGSIVEQRLSTASAMLGFPDRLRQVSNSSICSTRVYGVANEMLYGADARPNFPDRLPQASLPVQPPAATSIHTIFNEEDLIKILQEGLTDMEQDEYPPGDEVSLISNPYACLVNDHVYDYYNQFILHERLCSIAPTVKHSESQGKNIVHNVGHQKENPENIKTDLGKIKDPGAVITITGSSVDAGGDDSEEDLGLNNFWGCYESHAL